jgi:HlyD family secretion protein
VKRKWKIWIFVIALVVVTGGIIAGSKYSQRGIVTVQTGRVSRQDITSLVTASGEIKPKNYVNIGSNAMMASRIMEILVKEGDRVRRGQLLARLESVQPEAEVAAQRASLSSAEADSTASEASLKAADENLRSVQATIDRAAADLEQSKLDYARAEQLFKDK